MLGGWGNSTVVDAEKEWGPLGDLWRERTVDELLKLMNTRGGCRRIMVRSAISNARNGVVVYGVGRDEK